MTEEVKKENKVVVTPEDAKAAFEFWHQFNVPVMPGLQEAFDKFTKEPTFENQNYLKLMLCKAIATTDHECFKDETFQKVAEECSDIAYSMAFDRDFEEAVTVSEEAK